MEAGIVSKEPAGPALGAQASSSAVLVGVAGHRRAFGADQSRWCVSPMAPLSSPGLSFASHAKGAASVTNMHECSRSGWWGGVCTFLLPLLGFYEFGGRCWWGLCTFFEQANIAFSKICSSRAAAGLQGYRGVSLL